MFKTGYIGILMVLAVVTSPVFQGTVAANDETYQTIDPAWFRNAFDQFVLQQSGKAPDNIIISNFKVLHDTPVPLGKVEIRIIPKNNHELVEYVRLRALVNVNGVLENKVELCGWLDVFGTVVCASRDLKRGTVIQEKDLYKDRRNISSLVEDVVDDIHQVVGLTAKHNIKANDVLKRWVLKKTPVVQRGDLVTILVQSGGLRVTAPGKVLDEGFKGESVNVINTMSRKKIVARVIDSLTVQVDI